ncbi:MAG: ATP-binding cassette domain-containing protein [Deltaproteobacteria bacterium]|nr:ATP-binding cassette domain-containing protein [Deltaproteobacteria bacterium]NIS77104.1 ATP-binding cassette domain-containing protein [Deltaproteobacteria bacterium]
MKALLEVHNLSKNFGAVVAAEDINVTIGEKEVVGIIGANGAGKTTFVNIITGYVKPTGGTVRFQGIDITGQPPRKIIRMGICRSFQITQLFPDMDVWENLMVSCTLLNNPLKRLTRPFDQKGFRDRVMGTLEEFGISEYANEAASTLPQGVRKLLDVAMAMMGPTNLLLLDEPTSGVAIHEKFPLMDTIMESVKSTGAATIFIEHDMDIVQNYTDRIIAFYDGRVIADGPAADVVKNEEVIRYVIGQEPDGEG